MQQHKRTADGGSPSADSTFSRQHELAPLPLPDLPDTKERFLQWCRPVLTEAKFEQTRQALENFVRPGGPGEALDEDLRRYKTLPGVYSWLDDFWDQRYLGRRDPIALNANFFFLFKDTGDNQIDRATQLIMGALNFKRQLDDETLPVSRVRGKPVCMAGIKDLFATTRIPAHGRDNARRRYSKTEPGPSTARHIIVFRQSTMFRVDVIGPDGAAHSADEIAAALSKIAQTPPDAAEPGQAIGHLTTMRREPWADERKKLLGDTTNAALIEEIETALLCVSLEDVAPETDLEAGDQLLHGNSGNRYFDKAITLVVFANGRAGVNIEHVYIDGTIATEFVDFLHAATTEEHMHSVGAVRQGPPASRKLVFKLSAAQTTIICKAGADFQALAQNAGTRTFGFEHFGTSRIKQLKVSPDAFFQLAMQLAHRRTKGMNGTTYESIAVRQYYHGRVEAMRVITPELLTFIETMERPEATRTDKIATLRAAGDAHISRARQCQAGEAPEQHLWELLMIQGRRGAELGVAPEPAPAARARPRLGNLFGLIKPPRETAVQPFAFFESPGWVELRDDLLSTSSSASDNIAYFGFGSTAPECIGVGYVLKSDRINAFLCTPSCQIESRDMFAKHLADALTEMEVLLADV